MNARDRERWPRLLRHNGEMLRLASVLIVLAAAVGCTKAQAKTPAAPAPLATPLPPDRVIVPSPMPEPEAPPPPPAPAVPAPRPQTPATRPEPRPNATTPAPPATPVTIPEPPAAPPTLQTTANPQEVELRARAAIETAKHDLNLVNPGQLTTNARAQYDTAKGFLKQAESALQVKNVVLARELADKAAALASQLKR